MKKRYGKRARLNALIAAPNYKERRSLSAHALRRRVAGYNARKQGEYFEDEIDAVCARYRRLGAAIFARSRPKTGGAPGKMFFIERGQVDFVGQWQGVPVAFDTKTTASDPASWRFHPDDLFQAEFLRDWQKMGGIAFVLLRVTKDDRQQLVYVLTDVEALANGEAATLRTRQNKKTGQVTRTAPLIEYSLIHGWDFIAKLKALIEVEHVISSGVDGERLGGGAEDGLSAVQNLRIAARHGAVHPDEKDHRAV